MSTHVPVPQLDSPTLIAVARAALDDPTAVVTAWAPPVLLGASATAFKPTSDGVYRVRGTAMAGGQSRPWSAVLKVLRSPAGLTTSDGATIPEAHAENGAAFNYWKREALAYQEGLLAGLPPGITAPRCLAIMEKPERRVWLWLEDLAVEAQPWPLSRYALAARHLGRFNGAYASGRPLPVAPWLSPAPLESWLNVVIAQIMDLLGGRGLWQHPLMRLALSDDDVMRLHELWDGRATFLAVHRRLPRVFAHLDAFRGNLAGRDAGSGEESIAIDWAWAGIGAIGEELGPLVVATVLDGALPVEALPALESIALDGYLAGLGAAGWHGDPRLVRLGYAATAPLRYAALLAADVAQTVLFDGVRAAQEARHHAPIETVVRRWGSMITFLLDRAGQSRALAA